MSSEDSFVKVDELLSHRNFINIKGIVQDIKKIEHLKQDGNILRIASFLLSDQTGEVQCQLKGDVVKMLKNGDNILICNGRIDLINKTLILSLDSTGKVEFLPNWDKKDEKDLINISSFSYQYLK